MTPTPVPPRTESPGLAAGVALPCAFFAAAGVLDFVLGVRDLASPLPFWPVWQALGQLVAHGLMALGLWRRIALCRSIALVYCLASLVIYGFALVLAYAGAPVRFPDYVVVQSLFQVPSCAVLFQFLRSDRAGELYTRPLIG